MIRNNEFMPVDRAEARKNQLWYQSASAQQTNWAENAANNISFTFGNHWTVEDKSILEDRGQQPIAIQVIHQIVEQAVGQLTANRPGFRAVPREDSDQELAGVWSDLFQWMWQQSRGGDRLTSIVRDHYVQGRGVAHVHVNWNADYGRGEVVFEDLDPKEVFPDPRAKDPLWDDASFIIVRRLFTRGQVRQMWGQEIADILPMFGQQRSDYPWSTNRALTNNLPIHQFDVGWGDTTAEYEDQYEIIERYEKVKVEHMRLFNPETSRDEILSEEAYQQRLQDPAYLVTEMGQERVVLNEDDVAMYDRVYNELGPVYHMTQGVSGVGPQGQLIPGEPTPAPGSEDDDPNAIPGTTVALLPTTVAELVATQRAPVTPFMLDQIRVIASSGQMLLFKPFNLPTSHYPIIPFPNTANRNPYPVSDVDRLKDLQELLNKTQSLILAHQATSTNMKVFYPEGSIKDKQAAEQDWAKAGTAMIPYNPAFGTSAGSPGGIVFAQLPPLPASLYQNMDRTIALMERIAGVYAWMEGEGGQQQGGTYRGTLAHDEMGQRRMKRRLDMLHTSLERLGNVMKDFAQRVYTEQKVLNLVNPSGERRQTIINQQFPLPTFENAAKLINDITSAHVDIQIVAGSTLPSNRWAKFDNMLQLFDRRIVDDIAVLRASEFPDADQILERNAIYMQQTQALEQYQEEITKLQGDLQTADRAERNALKRVELAKFKAGLDALENRVGADAQIFRAGLAREKAAAKQQQAATA